VDAVVTDPPYFKVVDEPWDKAWDNADGFTDWLRAVAEQWQRVLKPNGTLYVFASPQMAARVELHVVEPAGFVVLNRIVWHKTNKAIHRANRDALFQYHSGDNERLIMAQPVKRVGDAIDANRAYVNALGEMRTTIFAPLRDYLNSERERAGFTPAQIDKSLGTFMATRHWFTHPTQWTLPTAEWYERLRALFNGDGGYYLRREYDDLRREYDDLRREYDDLRRPFDLGPELPHRPRGEVWRFAPVGRHEKGHDAHPCEKPQDLLAHIIATSTKPGAVVLDTFMGSGAIGVAATQLGRTFIGVEQSERWVDASRRWITSAARHEQGVLL
jgi:site-specific DNA-methyltransferase (adenine-specific)